LLAVVAVVALPAVVALAALPEMLMPAVPALRFAGVKLVSPAPFPVNALAVMLPLKTLLLAASIGTTDVLMAKVGVCPPVEVSPVPAPTPNVPVLLSVTLPPNAALPPPLRPVPAVTLSDGLASMALVTPPLAMLKVPLLVIGPPVKPAPLPTLVTVPAPAIPGKVCPEAKLIWPLLAIDRPVSAGVPVPERYSKFSVPEGLAVLLPAGSASQENSCGTAALVPLLNAEAIKSMGFETKPCVAVAVPVAGMIVPAAVSSPLSVAVVPLSAPVKLAVPPESKPVALKFPLTL